MQNRRRELEDILRNRVTEESLRLVCELVNELFKANVERMIGMNETGEELLRRQGRAQGIQEVMRALADIHKDPRKAV